MRRVIVHRDLLMRAQADPKYSHKFVLEFHLNVLGIHFRWVLSQSRSHEDNCHTPPKSVHTQPQVGRYCDGTVAVERSFLSVRGWLATVQVGKASFSA